MQNMFDELRVSDDNTYITTAIKNSELDELAPFLFRWVTTETAVVLK